MVVQFSIYHDIILIYFELTVSASNNNLQHYNREQISMQYTHYHTIRQSVHRN